VDGWCWHVDVNWLIMFRLERILVMPRVGWIGISENFWKTLHNN
jgi:hypothetical protein